jgi:hypothetical protein
VLVAKRGIYFTGLSTNGIGYKPECSARLEQLLGQTYHLVARYYPKTYKKKAPERK